MGLLILVLEQAIRLLPNTNELHVKSFAVLA